MAGGLKCSSRDLTLEFAGNRTGFYVCVYTSQDVYFFFFSFTVWKVVKVCLRKCLSILFNVLILSVFLYYCVCVWFVCGRGWCEAVCVM